MVGLRGRRHAAAHRQQAEHVGAQQQTRKQPAAWGSTHGCAGGGATSGSCAGSAAWQGRASLQRGTVPSQQRCCTCAGRAHEPRAGGVAAQARRRRRPQLAGPGLPRRLRGGWRSGEGSGRRTGGGGGGARTWREPALRSAERCSSPGACRTRPDAIHKALWGAAGGRAARRPARRFCGECAPLVTAPRCRGLAVDWRRKPAPRLGSAHSVKWHPSTWRVRAQAVFRAQIGGRAGGGGADKRMHTRRPPAPCTPPARSPVAGPRPLLWPALELHEAPAAPRWAAKPRRAQPAPQHPAPSFPPSNRPCFGGAAAAAGARQEAREWGRLPNVYRHALSMTQLREDPGLRVEALPPVARLVVAGPASHRYVRQDDDLWRELHQGVLTTGLVRGALGLYEKSAAKKICVPRSRHVGPAAGVGRLQCRACTAVQLQVGHAVHVVCRTGHSELLRAYHHLCQQPADNSPGPAAVAAAAAHNVAAVAAYNAAKRGPRSEAAEARATDVGQGASTAAATLSTAPSDRLAGGQGGSKRSQRHRKQQETAAVQSAATGRSWGISEEEKQRKARALASLGEQQQGLQPIAMTGCCCGIACAPNVASCAAHRHPFLASKPQVCCPSAARGAKRRRPQRCSSWQMRFRRASWWRSGLCGCNKTCCPSPGDLKPPACLQSALRPTPSSGTAQCRIRRREQLQRRLQQA